MTQWVPRLIAIAALSALAGCLGPAEFRGWPEPPYQFIACHGSPLQSCFDQARTACPGGAYQLAEQRSDPDIARHAIIIRCGAPIAAEPETPAPDGAPARAPAQPVPPK